MNDSAVPFLSQVNLPKTDPPKGLSIYLDAFLRRAIDILASALGLILLAPFFGWIAYRIRRDSPGPVFYRGQRAGVGGRVFGIFKFRTMYEEPESYKGAKVTAQDDPRITPLGKWLRDTKLNELPQLWNVFIGDMSLVGPRPEDPTLVGSWPASLKQEMLSVRPGITSPATILFRDEEARLSTGSVMEDYLRTIMPSKLRLDTLYIANRTFLSDLDVLFWTSVVLLPGIRRIPIPEHSLYQGPLSLFTSRYLSWFVIDSLITFLAVGLTGLIWRSGGPLDIGIEPAIFMAGGIALLFSMMNAIIRLSDVEWSRAPASDAIGLALSAFIATTLLLVVEGLLDDQVLLPQPMVLVSSLLSLAGFVTVRYRERLLTGFASRWLTARKGTSAVGERVLLIGAGHNAQMVTLFLTETKFSRAFTVVGIVDDDPRKHGKRFEGHRVMGTTQDIPELVKKHDIGLIFFTISNINTEDRQRIINICQQTQTIVLILPDIMQTLKEHFQVANISYFEDEQIAGDQGFEASLAELDELAKQGDFETLRQRLAEMRDKNKISNVKEL